MRLALALALGGLASCRSAPAAWPPSPPPRAPAPVRATRVVEPVAVLPPAVSTPCPTAVPLKVSVENRTRVHGNVCVAFNRVVRSVPGVVASSSPPIELHVTLGKLQGRKVIECGVTIGASQGSVAIASAAGGAKSAAASDIDGVERDIARACVDSLIEELLIRKIWPAVQQHAQSRPSPAPTAPTGIPVP